MTVESKDPLGKYQCIWFRKLDGQFQYPKFDGSSLQMVTAPVPGETMSA